MKLLLFIALGAVTAPAVGQDTPTPPPGVSAASSPIGGYQPASRPPPIPPGVTPVYVQAPSPDVAYPPPAPLADYPFCKRGQFDKCKQRNDPK